MKGDDEVELLDEEVDVFAALHRVLDVAESVGDGDLVQRVQLLHVLLEVPVVLHLIWLT